MSPFSLQLITSLECKLTQKFTQIARLSQQTGQHEPQAEHRISYCPTHASLGIIIFRVYLKRSLAPMIPYFTNFLIFFVVYICRNVFSCKKRLYKTTVHNHCIFMLQIYGEIFCSVPLIS